MSSAFNPPSTDIGQQAQSGPHPAAAAQLARPSQSQGPSVPPAAAAEADDDSDPSEAFDVLDPGSLLQVAEVRGRL